MMPRINESIHVLDSEDLMDKVYSGLLGICSVMPMDSDVIIGNTYGSNDNSLDALLPLKTGLYLPASKRCFWEGRFDVGVDPLPESGAIYAILDEGVFSWVSFKRLKSLPGFITKPRSEMVAHYRVIVSFSADSHWTIHKGGKIGSISSYFSIRPDGSLFPYRLRNLHSEGLNLSGNTHRVNFYGSGAINLIADSRYLWKIEATDDFKWRSTELTAKLIFGAEPEIVKSLFYSRSLPVTETGRKRPILHWVMAHKRRLKEGVDIDISKYLRGITKFEIENIPFQITSPLKNTMTG